MQYELSIKSHSDAPDFEVCMVADSKEEAAEMVTQKWDVDYETALKSIQPLV